MNLYIFLKRPLMALVCLTALAGTACTSHRQVAQRTNDKAIHSAQAWEAPAEQNIAHTAPETDTAATATAEAARPAKPGAGTVSSTHSAQRKAHFVKTGRKVMTALLVPTALKPARAAAAHFKALKKKDYGDNSLLRTILLIGAVLVLLALVTIVFFQVNLQLENALAIAGIVGIVLAVAFLFINTSY